MSYFVDSSFVKEKLIRFLNACHGNGLGILATYFPSSTAKNFEILPYADMGIIDTGEGIEFYNKPSHQVDNILFSLGCNRFISIYGIGKPMPMAEDCTGICFQIYGDGSMMISDPDTLDVWKSL